MYSRRFFIGLFVRIFLILIICISIALVFSMQEKWFTILGFATLLLLLIFDIVRYIVQVGNNISNIIVSLNSNEGSSLLSKKSAKLIDSKFIESIRDLQKSVAFIKSEQVIQALFIENLLDHIEVGIIALMPNGNIKFKNGAALRLMNLKTLKTLSGLEESNPEFYRYLISCKPGDEKLITLYADNETKKISLKSTRFISKDEDIKLIFFQNIKNEIDESLLQSWQNLIRILTHEINNTVSPIASLADSLSVYLSAEGNRDIPVNREDIDQRSIDVSLEGVNIIKERSNGLIDFVSRYRSLLPKKSLSIDGVQVAQLFYRLKILFSERLQNSEISIVSHVEPDDLVVKADQHYLEQVLINLITNSIDAFVDFTPESSPTIQLKSFVSSKGETVIQVIDNGSGISPENLDKVFLPFYSTKAKGTGVGLSLSMQIVRLHGGTLNVSSKVGEKTILTIKL